MSTKYDSRTTLYYKVLLEYYKVVVMIDPRSIWNVIYNFQCAEQQKSSYPPTSPNNAPATRNGFQWSLVGVTHETSFAMRGASWLALRSHQILCPPRKILRMIGCPSHMKRHLQCAEQQASPSNLSKYCAWHVKSQAPSHMKRHLKCAEQQGSPSNFIKYCACHVKLHSKI